MSYINIGYMTKFIPVLLKLHFYLGYMLSQYYRALDLGGHDDMEIQDWRNNYFKDLR